MARTVSLAFCESSACRTLENLTHAAHDDWNVAQDPQVAISHCSSHMGLHLRSLHHIPHKMRDIESTLVLRLFKIPQTFSRWQVAN